MSTDRPPPPSGSVSRPPRRCSPRSPRRPSRKPSALPNTREQVSLRIDSDVLEHFQTEGPGWQDRMNEALRAAAIADGMGAEKQE